MSMYEFKNSALQVFLQIAYRSDALPPTRMWSSLLNQAFGCNVTNELTGQACAQTYSMSMF